MRIFNRFKYILPLFFLTSLIIFYLLSSTTLNKCEVSGFIIICIGPFTALLILYWYPGFLLLNTIDLIFRTKFSYIDPLINPYIYYGITILCLTFLGALIDKNREK